MWPGWNIKKFSDENEKVIKFVFEGADAVTEAVLYRYPDYKTRTVVCCSVMSGCPIGCRFCGSGDHFVRALTAHEIVMQVHVALQTPRAEGVEPKSMDRLQIMFMSMGEPFLNMRELVVAINKLNEVYPNAELLVSTSGPNVTIGEFIKVSEDIPKVGLQYSIHESTDEVRNKLIPFKAKMTLDEIAGQGIAWSILTKRKAFINYCAHEHNTTDEDADRLMETFSPRFFNATVSVVCERTEHVAATNEKQRELAANFAAKLVERGFDVRMFDPAGQDTVGGGCGQLWYVQNWMKNNPDKARKSCGADLPVVNVPGVDFKRDVLPVIKEQLKEMRGEK